MGIMHAEDDSTLSARESKLKAFSEFFSKSCIVGTWSTHPDSNQILKKKYSNLCALCEKPDQCDYPDSRSGYDGALRCLADGGGDVAFTKVVAVKKFFGLPHGRIEAQESTYDHTKFKYLCPDGTMKPLDGDACIWAARPWPVFIAHNKFTSGDLLAKMKDDLQKISEFGENKQAMWRKDVLGMEDQHLLKDIDPVTPLKYLQHAGYYDVLTQRQEFGPYKAVRICEVTLGFFSGGKCERLSTSAFSRGVRPKIECVEEDSVDKCMNAVKTNRADLTFVDPHDAYFAIKKFNLKPLMMEKYGNDSHQYLALIVPKSSTIKSLKDINKDTKVCWSSKKAEYDVALEAFADAGMIERKCPFKFSSYGSQGMQNCLNEPSTTVNGKPNYDDLMFKPLTPALGKDYERYHPEDKFELVCPPSPLRMSRMPLTDVDKCNYGFIPPRMMMVKESINQLQKDELIAMFVKIGHIYDKNPDYFRLFGNFQDKPDVMVSNTATGFEPVKSLFPHWDEYTKTMDFMTAPQCS